MNQVVKQWIVKRKYLFSATSYRLLVLLEDGKYYLSLGEMGEYIEISKSEVEKLIIVET